MDFVNWLSLQEALALKGSYKGSIFQRLVAASYMIASSEEPGARAAYEDLQRKIGRQYNFLKSRWVMNPTMDDPYKSMRQMTQAINTQKAAGIKKPVVNVYAEKPGPDADSNKRDHPAWDNETNVRGRGVHDIISHYAGQHPFSARGEYGAYNRHLKTLCNPDQVKAGKCLAAQAMFTEVVAQTSCYYVYGDYPPQKMIILSDFDHAYVGRLAADSPLNKYFVLLGKELKLAPGFDWEEFKKEFPVLALELSKQQTGLKVHLQPITPEEVALTGLKAQVPPGRMTVMRVAGR